MERHPVSRLTILGSVVEVAVTPNVVAPNTHDGSPVAQTVRIRVDGGMWVVSPYPSRHATIQALVAMTRDSIHRATTPLTIEQAFLLSCPRT